ncbi:BlaI/MecI/CopY family transcriptional regulator [Acidithiobacillus sp. AMEEHan]|uniref:BlaI/MecI/CopY family transcriptional regulator n=1 Tax=Acidithiobacillus sp. AMEEHan TaxID=2994951 RepID=UPI0027E467CA|nr:BlaI/MecI/CopY family transcriptional regulator [Acidithiobacillus sp. AMEEHan]
MNRFRLPADDLEYEVLSTLWELGAATVRELHDELSTRVPRAYTTTAKVVDRLREKGLIVREVRGANTFVYRAAVKRETVERSRARNLLSRFLGTNPQHTVAALVQAAEEIDPSLLEELGKAILEHKKSTGQE